MKQEKITKIICNIVIGKKGFKNNNLGLKDYESVINDPAIGMYIITMQERKFIFINGRQIKRVVNECDLGYGIDQYMFDNMKERFDGNFTHEEMIIIQNIVHESNHVILHYTHDLETCEKYDRIYRKLRYYGYLA
jgi:hypothetical protein